MSPLSNNYRTPVQVNGYSCNNCTDVAYAKKHIDPAHPQSGPYNVNAASDPTRRRDALAFGVRLDQVDHKNVGQEVSAVGGLVDIRV
ncbi:MAG: hypothetical protein K2P70_01705 [Hyphomonadaceae bacterium]|nr:hypothetical protein [Hyphomonadaceae bacterium]